MPTNRSCGRRGGTVMGCRSPSSGSGARARVPGTATGGSAATPRACWSPSTATRRSSSTWGPALRALGDAMAPALRAEGRPLRGHRALTHLHFDHILGLPFFSPLHDPGAVLTVYGPRQDGGSLEETLPAAVQPPFFPVQMADFRGEVRFVDTGDEDFAIGVGQDPGPLGAPPGQHPRFPVEADGRVAGLPARPPGALGPSHRDRGRARAVRGCRSGHPRRPVHRRGVRRQARLGAFDGGLRRPGGGRGGGQAPPPLPPRSVAHRPGNRTGC